MYTYSTFVLPEAPSKVTIYSMKVASYLRS